MLVIGAVAVVSHQMFMSSGGGENAKPDVSAELGYVIMKPFLAPIIEGRRIFINVAVGVIFEVHRRITKPWCATA